jgi:hypothetical protein
LGIGDWGLGIGDWAQSPIPNPQSPIPNPQSPYLIYFRIKIFLKTKKNFIHIYKLIIIKQTIFKKLNLLIKYKLLE